MHKFIMHTMTQGLSPDDGFNELSQASPTLVTTAHLAGIVGERGTSVAAKLVQGGGRQRSSLSLFVFQSLSLYRSAIMKDIP